MQRVSALGVLILASCGGGPLDHKRLAGRVEDLRALAAEAHLLDQVQHPRAFGAEHRKFLVEKIHDANKDIARGVDDIGLEPFRMTAATLGTRLEVLVGMGADPLALEEPLATLQIRLQED